MRTTDDLDDRLACSREWPAGSMVDEVMARITPASPPRNRRWGRLFAGGLHRHWLPRGDGVADRREPANDAPGGRAGRA